MTYFSPMGLEDFLNMHKEAIDAALKDFLSEKLTQGSEISPVIRDLLKNLEEYNLRGGKRMRPVLVLAGYMAAGNEINDDIIRASIAPELMHNYFLAHDDIMDRGEMRRGKPSLHKIYEKLAQKNRWSDTEHFGESFGIMGGDFLWSWGVEAILGAGFSEERTIAAVQKYAELNEMTGQGQALDVWTSKLAISKVKEKDLLKIHKYKTAHYTVEGPLHLGAILGGATPQDLAVLTAYALPLGLAFQLQDDLLGVFGESDKTGKSNLDDLREGKRTLLVIEAYKRAKPAGRKYLDKYVGNPHLTQSQADRIRSIIEETGSRAYSEKKRDELAQQAIVTVDNSHFGADVKGILIETAKYLTKRNK